MGSIKSETRRCRGRGGGERGEETGEREREDDEDEERPQSIALESNRYQKEPLERIDRVETETRNDATS